jgi:hypothetical protein
MLPNHSVTQLVINGKHGRGNELVWFNLHNAQGTHNWQLPDTAIKTCSPATNLAQHFNSVMPQHTSHPELHRLRMRALRPLNCWVVCTYGNVAIWNSAGALLAAEAAGPAPGERTPQGPACRPACS